MIRLECLTDGLVGSNCYILHENGRCVVIDPNDPHLPLRYLKEHALVPEYIFLTHEHCDHIAGLTALREAYPQAVLYISDSCSRGIGSRRLNMSSMMEVFLHFSGKPGIHYAPFTCPPGDELFSGSANLDWRGHRFHFVSLPGHSPGGTGIFLDDEWFFPGDYLLPDRETSLRLPGGSREDYDGITKPFLLSLPEALHVFPGHGNDYRLQEPSGRFLSVAEHEKE